MFGKKLELSNFFTPLVFYKLILILFLISMLSISYSIYYIPVKNIDTKRKIAMETADLVTCTKEILNGKLHFL